MKIKFFFVLVLCCFFYSSVIISDEKVFIELKIENEIITNLDINKEKKYLIALNNNLKNLNKNQIYKISKDSLIREKVKKVELLKYFDLDSTSKIADNIVKTVIKNMNFKSEKDFELYLKDYDLTIDDVKKKLLIEATWNQLIYDKYKSNVKVDEKKLRNKLNQQVKENKIEEFNLSEILFELKTGENIQDKFDTVKNFINTNNFENAANIFSISDSSKFGGKIGWTSKAQISKNILDKIIELKTGEISMPIQINNSYLIIKINEKRNVEREINIEKEMEKLIIIEKDRQLNQYSVMYFNRIKNNLFINDL
tara:strand:- start:20 stop:952 length:933 start_codon:yes stop_codon:yes gene_type:complete